MSLVKPALVSLATLSEQTGVPVSTLRNWSRRYGVPRRLEHPGHRRYAPEDGIAIRELAAAIASGIRPQDAARGVRAPASQAIPWDTPAHQLRGKLRRAWAEHGAAGALDNAIMPFLAEVGRRWSVGELTVSQEHRITALVQSFLASWWTSAPAGDGPRAVVASVSGERHGLPLHAAATLLANRGWQVVFLGEDCPVGDILAEARAAQLVVTASSRGSEEVLEELRVLQAGARCPVHGGGPGLRELFGRRYMEDFGSLDRLLRGWH